MLLKVVLMTRTNYNELTKHVMKTMVVFAFRGNWQLQKQGNNMLMQLFRGERAYMQMGQYACIAERTLDFQVFGETFIQTRADGLEGRIWTKPD